MCKIAVWASRASMRGLKVIAFRYPEISDLLFDQPPFLIDYMILILVSDLIFILRDVLDERIQVFALSLYDGGHSTLWCLSESVCLSACVSVSSCHGLI